MGILEKKKSFIRRYDKITDERLIDKLEQTLIYEEARMRNSNNEQFSVEELIDRANRSNEDIQNDRTLSHDDLEKESEAW